MSADNAAVRATVRKISLRLSIFIGLMFFVNFLDRVSISFAGPSGMNHDLGLSAAQFGFAAGIFFIGYIILEIPSNLALHRFGARVWLARIMITWGIVTVLFTWVQSVTQLYWLRFFLGIAEAGFFPGAILFLSLWVPQRFRSQVLASFYIAQPLTIVIGSPLAALLMQLHGVTGLAGWRTMYLGVGLLAVIVGIVTFFLLPDRPSEAKWLTTDEKSWLKAELANEDGVPRHASPIKAMTNGRVWLLAVVYFGLVYGLYAIAFFLPTIIAGFQSKTGAHFGVMEKALITAIPYLPAAIVLFLWSRDATKRGVRAWHIGIPALAGAIAIPLAVQVSDTVAVMALMTVVACAIFAALPVFWSIPSRFLTGGAAAAGIALINTVGNVAGFVAPYITGYLKSVTGGYQLPMLIVGVFMALSAVVIFSLTLKQAPPAPQANGTRRATP
ncbi:MFS transporter [Acidisoma silvae]|uniref:MFS transporter n=1 Tax=Acidisoma silvae TaxID=2802396 RepID=A0A963YRS2_9PROT|nr:MFS transporter [Acidisoma silvae]MCB8875210.1 MFS transporter [Acidisoma silvae]